MDYGKQFILKNYLMVQPDRKEVINSYQESRLIVRVARLRVTRTLIRIIRNLRIMRKQCNKCEKWRTSEEAGR